MPGCGRYGVAVDPATWPVQLVSKVMPFFLLLVMLMPLTKRLFAKDARSKPLGKPGDDEGSLPLYRVAGGLAGGFAVDPVVSDRRLLESGRRHG